MLGLEKQLSSRNQIVDDYNCISKQPFGLSPFKPIPDYRSKTLKITRPNISLSKITYLDDKKQNTPELGTIELTSFTKTLDRGEVDNEQNILDQIKNKTATLKTEKVILESDDASNEYEQVKNNNFFQSQQTFHQVTTGMPNNVIDKDCQVTSFVEQFDLEVEAQEKMS